jgi:hypothetical protein
MPVLDKQTIFQHLNIGSPQPPLSSRIRGVFGSENLPKMTEVKTVDPMVAWVNEKMEAGEFSTEHIRNDKVVIMKNVDEKEVEWVWNCVKKWMEMQTTIDYVDKVRITTMNGELRYFSLNVKNAASFENAEIYLHEMTVEKKEYTLWLMKKGKSGSVMEVGKTTHQEEPEVIAKIMADVLSADVRDVAKILTWEKQKEMAKDVANLLISDLNELQTGILMEKVQDPLIGLKFPQTTAEKVISHLMMFIKRNTLEYLEREIEKSLVDDLMKMIVINAVDCMLKIVNTMNKKKKSNKKKQRIASSMADDLKSIIGNLEAEKLTCPNDIITYVMDHLNRSTNLSTEIQNYLNQSMMMLAPYLWNSMKTNTKNYLMKVTGVEDTVWENDIDQEEAMNHIKSDTYSKETTNHMKSDTDSEETTNHMENDIDWKEKWKKFLTSLELSEENINLQEQLEHMQNNLNNKIVEVGNGMNPRKQLKIMVDVADYLRDDIWVDMMDYLEKMVVNVASYLKEEIVVDVASYYLDVERYSMNRIMTYVTNYLREKKLRDVNEIVMRINRIDEGNYEGTNEERYKFDVIWEYDEEGLIIAKVENRWKVVGMIKELGNLTLLEMYINKGKTKRKKVIKIAETLELGTQDVLAAMLGLKTENMVAQQVRFWLKEKIKDVVTIVMKVVKIMESGCYVTQDLRFDVDSNEGGEFQVEQLTDGNIWIKIPDEDMNVTWIRVERIGNGWFWRIIKEMQGEKQKEREIKQQQDCKAWMVCEMMDENSEVWEVMTEPKCKKEIFLERKRGREWEQRCVKRVVDDDKRVTYKVATKMAIDDKDGREMWGEVGTRENEDMKTWKVSKMMDEKKNIWEVIMVNSEDKMILRKRVKEREYKWLCVKSVERNNVVTYLTEDIKDVNEYTLPSDRKLILHDGKCVKPENWNSDSKIIMFLSKTLFILSTIAFFVSFYLMKEQNTNGEPSSWIFVPLTIMTTCKFLGNFSIETSNAIWSKLGYSSLLLGQLILTMMYMDHWPFNTYVIYLPFFMVPIFFSFRDVSEIPLYITWSIEDEQRKKVIAKRVNYPEIQKPFKLNLVKGYLGIALFYKVNSMHHGGPSW